MQVPNTAPAPADDPPALRAPAQEESAALAAGQPAPGAPDVQAQPDLVFYDPVGRAAPRWRLRLAGAVGALFLAGLPAAALADPQRKAGAAAGVRRLVRRLRPSTSQSASAAVLEVTSTPDGASVVLDDEEKGRTPLSLSLPAGRYRVAIRRSGYIDGAVRVELDADAHARLATDLWSATPRVARVRPALPGATIAGGTFLDDGTLAVSLLLPGGARQLWLADPSRPQVRVDGGALPENCPVAALSPDGARVAWVVSGTGSGWTGASARPDEVWVGHTAIHAGAPGERLLDLAWAPGGRALLLVAQRGAGPTAVQPDARRRTRLLWLTADGSGARGPQELAEIPSDVVAGTWAWSPDGRWVAFTAKPAAGSQPGSLCLLRTPESPADGAPSVPGMPSASDAAPRLRYVADLARDAGPLPAPPVAWSADGAQIAHAAAPPSAGQSGLWPIGAKPEATLVTAGLEARSGGLSAHGGARFSGYAPVWRADGTLGALARPKNKGPLHVRFADPAGVAGESIGSVPLAALPPVAPTACSVWWDSRRAQAFVAVRESQLSGSSQASCWLVRFAGDPAGAAEAAR